MIRILVWMERDWSLLYNYSHIEIHFHGNFGTERIMLQKSEAEERPVKMQYISSVGADAGFYYIGTAWTSAPMTFLGLGVVFWKLSARVMEQFVIIVGY